MNQLNDEILAFLFSKRYMDFKTCSSLRSVSAQFNIRANKYFRSLRDFNMTILQKNFHWYSKSVATPYSCLLETVSKRCDNLEKLTGIKIKSDKLNSVSRICLQKLPKLTSIVIMDETLTSTDIFDFLKQLPKLRSVKVGSFDNDNVRQENGAQFENKNLTEEEKLVVSELSLDYGDFWRIFRIDHLKKLEVSVCMLALEKDEDFTTFCGVVECCQRLEQLDLEISADYITRFPSLLRLPGVLPNFKQLNLNLYTSTENVPQIVRQYPSVEKFIKKLGIYQWEPEPTGDRIDS